jgi:hypothetical protein
MEIRIYVGPHKTASQHLAAVLSNNIDLLEAVDTIFYSSSRNALRHINTALKTIAAGGDKEDATAQMLHSLTRGRDAKRLLIINPNVVGSVAQPFGKDLFYPRTSGLVHQLQTLFEGHSMQLFSATRNPATFLPSCYAESLFGATFASYESFLGDVNLYGLKWSPFLHRLQGKQSDIPLTTWRFEDYPYIWRDIAQAFSGIENSQDLQRVDGRIHAGMTLRGAQLMNKYIEENPPRTKEDFGNIKQAFLKKFPSSPNEIIGPGWPPEAIKTLTENYEDDWYYIERMDQIRTILPRDFD